MKAVFIYCLKDPLTGDIRYIGKTDNLKKRFSAHIKGSVKKKTHLGCWLKSLLGEKPILVVLHEVAENESWAEEERRYISCARAMGVDLVNATDGGEGASGWIPAPETRAKMSAARKGVPRGPASPEARAAMSVAHRGVSKGPPSPETCAAISAALTGVPLSSKRRAAMIAAARTPERRAASSAARTGVPRSPETCAAMSASWTPERRAAQGEAMSVAHKGVPWSPARRAAYERRFGQAKNTL